MYGVLIDREGGSGVGGVSLDSHATRRRGDFEVVALPIAILIVTFVLALVMGPSLS